MDHTAECVVSAVIAVVGGAIAVALLFAGFGVGALAIGLAPMLVAGVSRSSRSGSNELRTVLGLSVAFALLTWAVLALVAGAIWGDWE